MLYRDVIRFDTKINEIKDITVFVRNAVQKSKVRNGTCHVYFMGTTGAVFINENERMVHEDFKKILERLAPSGAVYMHPSNSHSHLRSMLASNEKTIPISDGQLLLGTWQSVLFAEYDVTNRSRELVVTVSGD